MKYRIEIQQVFGTEGVEFDTNAQWLEAGLKPRGLAAAREALVVQVNEWKTGAPHRIVAIAADGTRTVVETLAYESPLAKLVREDNEARATDLAVRIVGYCHAKALTLGGLVTELGADEPLDAERASRLVSYCDANFLDLGGMVENVRLLFNLPPAPALELLDVDALFANETAEYTCRGTENECLAGNCPGCANCIPPAPAHERFVARKAYVDDICTRMHCTKDANGTWVFANDVYEHMFGQLMGWYDDKWSAMAEVYEVAVMYATNPTECSLSQYAQALAVIAFVEAEEYDRALSVGLVY